MPQYNYQAKSLEGKEESAIMEAESKTDLAKILHQKGYFLLTAEVIGGKKKKNFLDKAKYLLSNIFGAPLVEKLFFTRNLELMVRTGVALPKALTILSVQVKNGKFKRALSQVSEDITKGQNLSQCLSRFPRIFSPLYQETLKVGEETGKVESALHILEAQMTREHKLKSGIISSMIYPMVVLGMAFVIGIFMFVFALPKLKITFQEMQMTLPFTTRAIFALADFLQFHWLLSISFLLGLIIFLWFFIQSKKTARLKSFLLLRFPVVSKISKTANTALALRAMSSLLAAGVPIIRALEITGGALSNFYFKQSLKQAAISVEKGVKLSQALKPYQNLFGLTVFHMAEVGEETGETPKVLGKLADFYEEEVAASTERLAALFEPALIVLIGGVVGFFALSMMQPMFSMMGGVK